MARLLTAVMLLLLLAPQAYAAGVEDAYMRAKSCYGEVRVTPAKAKRHGEWQHCIDLFENVHKKYPTSERAPQALYNVGRLHVEAWKKIGKQGDVESAIRAFNQLVREYPKSSLADDALFEIGVLRKKPLGQLDRAETAFAYIVENYPYGDMADKAKAELASFGEGAPQTEEAQAEAHQTPAAAAKPGAGKGVALEVETVGAPKAKEGVAAQKEAAAQKEVSPPPKAAGAAAPAKGGKGAAFAAPAGPKNPATLDAIEIADDESETSVSLKLTHRAPYSVEFTDMGARTKSPPKLDMLLLYTKSGEGLAREISVNSRHLSKIKLKRGLLEGGIHILFELTPESSYTISSKGDRIVLRFKHGEARALPPTRGAPTKKARGQGKEKPFVVVVDPGHGGGDPGAIGPGGSKEKDVTLALSRRLAGKLKELPGAKVYLTRSDDRDLTLEERNALAVSKKADLFISVHANASTDRRMSGIETYYLNNATDEAAAKLARRENRASRKKLSDVEHILSTMLQNYDAAESRLLAGDVQGSLVDRMGKRYKGVKNRRVRSAMFYVLVGAKCPAILVETSFISNPREEKRLRERPYQEDIAESIATGVQKYIKASDRRVVAL